MGSGRADVDVIFMGVNATWAATIGPQSIPGVTRPYILHVGGDQWYKNRAGVISIWKALGDIAQRTKLVMVGPELNPGTDVICLPHVEDETLRALYSSAELLLFPSIEEGFGWPIVEAQACGCRVVTTQKAPMTEAGGDAAFYIPERPADSKNRGWSESAALVVKRVLEQDEAGRADSIARGLKNAARFSTEIMAQRYVAIYKELLYKR
jgi:glycosyltransferase involved in cell wall biosynthesis